MSWPATLPDGRRDDSTVFDSTGLAIQDLAIGIEVVNRYGESANAGSFSGVQMIEIA
jgi:ornithine cyclodeaminase/alanine dehydrogenase-like protein (mu-crystallin family)